MNEEATQAEKNNQLTNKKKGTKSNRSSLCKGFYQVGKEGINNQMVIKLFIVFDNSC